MTAATAPAATVRYLRPDWATRNLFNPAVARLTRLGVSVRGSRVLEVRGRRSGKLRTTPVNLLELDGARYLVAPRGSTEWVRNVRAAQGATLRLGRRREAVRAVELADGDKLPVLRRYLELWAFEVGKFFDGVGADASDTQLAARAAGVPVFRLERADPDRR